MLCSQESQTYRVIYFIAMITICSVHVHTSTSTTKDLIKQFCTLYYEQPYHAM